jgi:hypothetical protein
VHPIQTGTVGYISARSDLLCAAFSLAAFLAYRRWSRKSDHLAFAACLGSLGLALAAKEVALVVPLVFAAYDVVIAPSWSAGQRRRRRRILGTLVAFVLALTAVRLVVFAVLEHFGNVRLSLWRTALTQAGVILRYLRLLLFPIGQSLVHEVPDVESWADPMALAGLGAVLLLALAAWRGRGRQRVLAFGVLAFLILLIPSSSVIALNERMAEHRLYMPSIGFFIAIGSACEAWRWRLQTTPFSWLPAPALALTVLLLGHLAIERNWIWGDPVQLWQESALKAPRVWAPHYALGDTLRDRGRYAEAAAAYRHAIRVLPTEPRAHVGLGICLAELGRDADAGRAFERALEVDPTLAQAYTNLGILAARQGQQDRARELYDKALELQPDNQTARRRLIELVSRVNRVE